MFRKFLIFAVLTMGTGLGFADGDANLSQPVATAPVWPIGSEADVDVAGCTTSGCEKVSSDNIRIVSKIGADLVVENNINTGSASNDGSFSGGANMLHGYQAPSGFNNYENQSEMPLLHQEMMEDDGGQILSVSRSNRKKTYSSEGLNISADANATNNAEITDMEVDQASDADTTKDVTDQVRSWVVASGQTLHEVLQDWCNKEGWDLVWGTEREYPIEASAVFKGRFVDVSSALVRNFGRATPVPYAKFYKGNRVLVITTAAE